MLHLNPTSNAASTSNAGPPTPVSSLAGQHSSLSVNSALISTALLSVLDTFGRRIQVRALIDPGSQVSFILERITNRLQLPRNKLKIPISGIIDSSAVPSNGTVRATIKPYGLLLLLHYLPY